MTQLHFTVDQEEIQNLINESVDNKIAKSILTKEIPVERPTEMATMNETIPLKSVL